jgi:hypothetical protein
MATSVRNGKTSDVVALVALPSPQIDRQSSFHGGDQRMVPVTCAALTAVES